MLQQGAALLAGGRYHEAVQAFQQALRQEPASVPARMGLARALAGTGDGLAACAWLSDAARLAPMQTEPVQELADLLLARKEYAQAAPLYGHLLEQFGARTRGNLLHGGFCQEQRGHLERAVALYREAIEREPDFLEAHVDLAGVLWRLEDFEGSLAHAQRAVQLGPAHPYAVRILGTALLNLNRLDEAEAALRHALTLQPGFVLAELDLAFTLLLAGRLEEGWPWYECRWRDTQRMQRPVFYQAAHEWAGPQARPLAGLSLAVYGEQGLGDVIQFLRYVPLLQAQGARVACVIQPELVPLVEASFEGVACLVPGRNLTVDGHAALMDLPARLGTTLASVPAPVAYLRAPAEARARWADRLAVHGPGLRVGFAWSGSMQQVNNRNRAIPLSTLAPLLQLPGVRAFSLQKGDAGAATDTPVAEAGLIDLTPEWHGFADSAAMIEALDLVITVDTAIAHLAGALGKPVWILLPPNADWRWLLARDDSPWYPTARLFRRDFGEPRAAQVARVGEALRARLASAQAAGA